jgi:hypothetical protein
MNLGMNLALCLMAALGVAAEETDFHEGWEAAVVGLYAASDATFIRGEEGQWLVKDVVSEYPQCGPTPQRAAILEVNGGKVLRLTSNDSETTCSDAIWVALTQLDSVNEGFAIPLTPNLTLSFEEMGELTDPQPHGLGHDCLLPPCFDNISLLLSDNNGNLLAYVLQRWPEAVPNVRNAIFGDRYREIFLDPEAVSYRRNLFNDFLTIPLFDPADAQILSIEFQVDEHGSATLDDLRIRPAAPATAIPVYRFWAPALGGHFFTADEAEKQKLLDDYPGFWQLEGVGFYTPADETDPNVLPVFRFWSGALSSHFYTMDESEREKLETDYPAIWTFEGIAFYAFPEGLQPAAAQPVYRLYAEALGDHFYTASEAEVDKLFANYPTTWTFEGVAWYAYPP